MGKKQIIKIGKDGLSVRGLYADFLQDLGEVHVERASHVEFCDSIGRWVVELQIGPYAHSCLVKTFSKRSDALAAEVAVLTEQHAMCLL